MKNSTVMKLTCVGLVIGTIGFGATGFGAWMLAMMITATGCTGMICQSVENNKGEA